MPPSSRGPPALAPLGQFRFRASQVCCSQPCETKTLPALNGRFLKILSSPVLTVTVTRGRSIYFGVMRARFADSLVGMNIEPLPRRTDYSPNHGGERLLVQHEAVL